MHWSLGAIIIVLVAFAAGGYVAKNYPGSIPVVT